MIERTGGHDLKRREFLSVGALPLAAALGNLRVGDQDGPEGSDHPNEIVSPDEIGRADEMGSAHSAQGITRVGFIAAGANVRSAQITGFGSAPGCEIVTGANRRLESRQRAAA